MAKPFVSVLYTIRFSISLSNFIYFLVLFYYVRIHADFIVIFNKKSKFHSNAFLSEMFEMFKETSNVIVAIAAFFAVSFLMELGDGVAICVFVC